ncbi:hypothetical protein VTO42DRAFT_159 [Malbranchea cinnamomea]
MSSAWIPPAHGSPCYIEIPALDTDRAQAFYAAVFNWTFKGRKPETGEAAGFSFPEPRFSSLTGGITKVDKIKGGAAAPKLYFYVDDLAKTMDAIVANGGKKLSDVVPESDFGLMMYAEDTEGNELGIYVMKNKA